MASTNKLKAEVERLSALATKKPDEMSDRELREVAKNFESLFVRILLKEMRKTIPGDGFLQYSHATQMYTEIGDDALASDIAEHGGLGIADLVYQQLKETRDNLYTAQDIIANQKTQIAEHEDAGKKTTRFLPLYRHDDPTQNAIPLKKGHEPIPIPKKEKKFMKLQNQPIIPLDRIQKR